MNDGYLPYLEDAASALHPSPAFSPFPHSRLRLRCSGSGPHVNFSKKLSFFTVATKNSFSHEHLLYAFHSIIKERAESRGHPLHLLPGHAPRPSPSVPSCPLPSTPSPPCPLLSLSVPFLPATSVEKPRSSSPHVRRQTLPPTFTPLYPKALSQTASFLRVLVQ